MRSFTQQLTIGSATALAALALLAAACGGDDAGEASGPTAVAESGETASASAGLRTVAPAEAATVLADGPDDLVVLDVRTPEEFAEGHLADATLVDFYEPDFADQLAGLDRDVPYVLYCRSGNRSGQTLAMMAELGFTDVTEVGGGALAWTDAGLELVGG